MARGKRSSGAKVSSAPPKRGTGSRRKAGGHRGRVERKPRVPMESVSEDLRRDVSTVLVTGAAGPIGHFLVQYLAREGFAVVAADEPGSDIPVPKAGNTVNVMAGDLSRPSFLKSCLEGVDAIFHASSVLDPRQPHGILSSVNVEVPRMLYQEASRRGVRRFLHFSSGFVYKRCHGPIAEDAVLEAENDCEQTLLEAEKIFLAEGTPGLPLVTVLRSAVAYGPGSRGFLSPLAALAPLVKALGPYYIPLSGGSRMNLVHGEDAARAALFLLFHPRAYGEVFNVADRDPLSLADRITLSMESYGLKPLVEGEAYPPATLIQSILPFRDREELFDPLNRVGTTLWERMVRKRNVKKALAARIDLEMLLFGRQDLVLENRRLLDLGFRYKYPKFRKGWERALAWYERNRWIPRRDEF